MAKNKTYNTGLLKTELSEDKKKIHFTLSVKDLKWLFNNSPGNVFENTIKNKKTEEFVDYVLNRLTEPSIYDDNSVKWLIPFEEIFADINDSDKDFVTYHDC